MQNVSLEWTLLRPDTTEQWTRARRLLQGQRYVKERSTLSGPRSHTDNSK